MRSIILMLTFFAGSASSANSAPASLRRENEAREISVSACADKRSCAMCMGATSVFIESECHWCGNECLSTIDKTLASCPAPISPGSSRCVESSWIALLPGTCSDYTSATDCDQWNRGHLGFHKDCHWVRGGDDQCAAALAASLSQPAIRPSDWFLSTAQIKQARGGVGTGVSEATFNNHVTFVPDGKTWFEKWVEDMEAADEGDVSVLSGWLNGPADLPMNPLAANPDQTHFGSYVQAAIERGVSFFGLTWRNILEDGPLIVVIGKEKREFAESLLKHVEDVAKTAPTLDARKSRVFIDGRGWASGTSSVHQKFYVTGAMDSLKSIVGGIDLTYARWDEYLVADEETLRKRNEWTVTPYSDGGMGGWIDRGLHLVGPASAHTYNVFQGRWADDEQPAYYPSWVVEDNGDYSTRSDLPKAAASPSSQESTGMKHAVQVLRTVPCSQVGGSVGARVEFPFAPKGDLTILESLLKAIAVAKNYILIEEQYGLVQHDIQHALHQSLAGGLAYLVVLLAPAVEERCNGSSLHQYVCGPSQYEMWSPFVEMFPDRVTILQRSDCRFVHSKTWLMDDMYFQTGSANMNDRSYFQDQELNAAVVDEDLVVGPDGFLVGSLPLAIRKRMFAEMSGKSEAYYDDVPLAVAVATITTGISSNARVEVLPMSMLRDASSFLGFTAGDGLCSTLADSGTTCEYRSSFDENVRPKWGGSSSCSKMCGGGKVYRMCIKGKGAFADLECTATEANDCNTQECTGPSWNPFGSWSSCTEECGEGSKTQTRTCQPGEGDRSNEQCTGSSSKTVSCNSPACQPPSWSPFGSWSSCSKNCGGGSKTKTRSCTPGTGQFSKTCSGSSSETVSCNTSDCQMYWTGYSGWALIYPVCESGYKRIDTEYKVWLGQRSKCQQIA